MRALAACVLGLLLVGCDRGDGAADNSFTPRNLVLVGRIPRGLEDLSTYCDSQTQDRVYVLSGPNRGGVTVVANGCRTTQDAERGRE